MRRIWMAAIAVLLVAGGVVGWHVSQSDDPAPKMTLVASGGCEGAGCNGLNPSGRCDDGRSVASKHIQGYGLLELRYSKSCKANWGRFTPYKTLLSPVAATGYHARVTVWNPDKKSYGTAHHSTTEGSSWSYMTNGELEACTGVELSSVRASGMKGGIGEDGEAGTDWESYDSPDRIAWYWGPCY